MFSGSQAVNIDDKGRLAIPARFRAEITADAAGQLAIAPTPEGIKLYPQPVFEHIAKHVIPAHPDVAQRRLLQRLFVGGSMQLEMDAQGRLLVPPEFRQTLGAELMLVGQVDHFLLMPAAEWAAFKAASTGSYEAAYAALNL